jgi:Zn-dependent oligopeptidase
MDPLTVAATAVAATVMTKALEKTGEKLGEKVFDQSEKFLTSLKRKAPETASAIQKVPEEPLDYGQAVLEVHALAETDSELAHAIQLLAESAAQDPNPRLTEAIREITTNLSSQQPTVQHMGKLAEKIGLVVQGGTVSIQNIDVQ